MTTDYDTIAEEYKRTKLQPWRLHIESFTLAEMVGDLAGKSVLDLACGEGFHSRVLKKRGARRVVGVDLSSAMIDLARAEEDRHPLGIEYVVEDARRLDLGEPFDVVFAAYLLNYSRSPEELLEMTRAIARHLKPGCRFVTLNCNSEFTGVNEAIRHHGFEYDLEEGPPREGAPIVVRFFLQDTTFEITNYYLSVPTHEWAFREAGMGAVRWHAPRVSPQGLAEHGPEHWAGFLEHKPVIGLESTKDL